jgi:hypothetical protein
MSDLKRVCPSCDCEGRDIGRAFRDGESCPFCGISATTVAEIDRLWETYHGDDETILKLREAIVAREKAVNELADLKRRFDRFADAVSRAVRTELYGESPFQAYTPVTVKCPTCQAKAAS